MADEQVKQSSDLDKPTMLPPLPGPELAPVVDIPSLIAGFVRAFATNGMILLVSIVKGSIQWWFRVPIKMFRPYAVNPWVTLTEMANTQKKDLNARFVAETLRNEGWSLVRLNVLPLMAANAVVGAILFNSYSITAKLLTSTDYSTFAHYIAGAFAGSIQSVLATPLGQIQKLINRADIVERRHHGIHRVTIDALKSQSIPLHLKSRVLYFYKGVLFNTVRDSIGFGLFFGVFNTLSVSGKAMTSRLWARKHGQHRTRSLAAADGVVVIGSGALAGVAYQSIVYPLENLKTQVRQVQHTSNKSHSKFQIARTLIYKNGFKSIFQGITPQLLRAMPPSAMGLFVYEMASEWIDSL
ncbi:mitochondrial carrier domain-containing protein [Globomyces pollinis-pini]|nr:mitochondrial carrier domain-containing protein [Globomyces pollinis-pini]